MEDWNMIATDCIVISCSCQCLMLQLVVFMLLKLPYRIVRNTRDFARKKLGVRYGRKAREKRRGSATKDRFHDRVWEFEDGFMRIEIEELFRGRQSCWSCMKDIEGVLDERSRKGEFAFGSFWGRKEGSESEEIAKNESDMSLIQFELVEIIHSFR